METKIFEVRDRGTFISMLAIKLDPINSAQIYHISMKCGYGLDNTNIMITHLGGEQRASADPYFWNDRTYTTAHHYIQANFDILEDGDVIDVEYILKETATPKKSEQGVDIDMVYEMLKKFPEEAESDD